MPLLPSYGNLGENSDSIFEASKNVARTSLVNIQPPDSVDAEFITARKSSEELATQFLEFKSLVSDYYQNMELLELLPEPNSDDESYDFIALIKFLMAALRKAVVFFRKFIKPNVSDLDGKEIADLIDIQRHIKTYSEAVLNWKEFFESINYGENTWELLTNATFDFLEQVTIALNSYRQNAPVELTGAGRNFYGKKINSTADIPTIWSRRIQDCPTKYLL